MALSVFVVLSGFVCLLMDLFDLTCTCRRPDQYHAGLLT